MIILVLLLPQRISLSACKVKTVGVKKAFFFSLEQEIFCGLQLMSLFFLIYFCHGCIQDYFLFEIRDPLVFGI